MTFSIVVPVFNSEQYIDKAIRSVLSQSASDWELIITDDGSTDGSLARVEAYAALDDRIKVFRQKNRGQFFARQNGINNASGDYVIFLDSDDELESDCIETLNNFAHSGEWDIIMYTGIALSPVGKHSIGYIAADAEEISPEQLKLSLMSSHDLNSLCIKAFRRELFDGDETDYSAFEGSHCGEDKARLLFPVTKAKKILYVPNCLYRYILREGSTSRERTGKNVQKLLATEMFDLLREYSHLWGMDDAKHKRLLEAYNARHFLSVYYGIRRSCHDNDDMASFRSIGWDKYIDSKAASLLHSSELSGSDKLKLAAALLHF